MVKRLKAFDCNDLMLEHVGPGPLLFVRASDYDALEKMLRDVLDRFYLVDDMTDKHYAKRHAAYRAAKEFLS